MSSNTVALNCAASTVQDKTNAAVAQESSKSQENTASDAAAGTTEQAKSAAGDVRDQTPLTV